MPTVTINQQSITIPEGTTIIQAAQQLQIEIPHYCYHPGLSLAGSCRMCLVEIEKNPKLQPACYTRISDGMVIYTNTEKVKQTVSGVLEFLLLNHPLDCPVCDQAGECYLQEYYMKFGLYDSRMNEDKIKRHKAQAIGPHVILDNERCILCSRCVRFVEEVSDSHEIGILNRGGRSEIRLLPDKALDNNYSGNVIDICPVGALTDRNFRFQCRVWYLDKTNSICNGCSRGCNITVEANTERPHHAEGRRIMRLKPRYNPDVNQWWICDIGRYGSEFIDHPSRLASCLERQEGQQESIGWHEALGKVSRRLSDALHHRGEESVVVIASPQLTNEDLFLIRRFFGEDLELPKIDYRVPERSPSAGDNFLLLADRNPNTRGAEAILMGGGGFNLYHLLQSPLNQSFSLLYLFEQDLVKKLGEKDAKSFLSRFEYVIYQGTNENETSQLADLVLPSATYAEVEGTFTNFEGRVQKINRAVAPWGDSLPSWQIVAQLAKMHGKTCHYDCSEDVFAELADRVPEFENLSYASIGNQGIRTVITGPMKA